MLNKMLLGGMCAVAAATSAGASTFPITMIAESHPNGNQSADGNAVDDRDYGLRLDNADGVNTFAFVDVTMTFFDSGPGVVPGSIMARLEGTIAHLQSSEGGTLGYASGSGLDVADQRWQMSAEYRLIGETGTWATEALPYQSMLDDLLGDGSKDLSQKLTFSLADLSLDPMFDEGTEAAVFSGARNWDERPGSDQNPNAGAFYISPRYRLSESGFPGEEWDILAGAGWLEPYEDSGNGGYINDALFTLRVPEPSSLALLAVGGLGLIRRRNRR